MRRLFGCPDIVSLTEKFLMARNFYRIFTENNPVMGDSKTFGIPEAKRLTGENSKGNCGKMLNFIEHFNVRGEMRCNREDPDAVYNIIQGGGLKASSDHDHDPLKP